MRLAGCVGKLCRPWISVLCPTGAAEGAIAACVEAAGIAVRWFLPSTQHGRRGWVDSCTGAAVDCLLQLSGGSVAQVCVHGRPVLTVAVPWAPQTSAVADTGGHPSGPAGGAAP